MIINHKYKFIFIKTKKTAGTSIEIALSEFCGGEDIVTRTSDEAIRQKLGFTRPQNSKKTENGIGRVQNHTPAIFVKTRWESIWEDYFTFCFERNPFDKAISMYYHHLDFYTKRDVTIPAVNGHISAMPIKDLSNWSLYAQGSDGGHVIVDFAGRYENLSSDLDFIVERLGLPHGLTMTRAKSNFRTNHDHYSTVLNAESRATIERVCANEIEHFRYHWEDQ